MKGTKDGLHDFYNLACLSYTWKVAWNSVHVSNFSEFLE